MVDPNVMTIMKAAIAAKITTSFLLMCLLCQVFSVRTKGISENTISSKGKKII